MGHRATVLTFPRKMIVAEFVIMHEDPPKCVYDVVLITKSCSHISNLLDYLDYLMLIAGNRRPFGFKWTGGRVVGKC